jgi:hypothetical protein
MSLAAAVLTFREGIEAALIIAIMLGYLRKVVELTGRHRIYCEIHEDEKMEGEFIIK